MPAAEIIKTRFQRSPALWSSLAGAFVGFLLLRPYTLLVYSLFYFLETGSLRLHGQLHIGGPKEFSFFLLLTSISFVLLGGIIGLVFGKWYDRRQRHIRERIEREKKEAALETVKELNVTLSHYIINSAAIIRGFAQRGGGRCRDQRIGEYFSIIEEEADKTIAVVSGLSELKEIESIKYVSSGTVMMLDLKRQIDEQLRKLTHMGEGADDNN